MTLAFDWKLVIFWSDCVCVCVCVCDLFVVFVVTGTTVQPSRLVGVEVKVEKTGVEEGEGEGEEEEEEGGEDRRRRKRNQSLRANLLQRKRERLRFVSSNGSFTTIIIDFCFVELLKRIDQQMLYLEILFGVVIILTTYTVGCYWSTYIIRT